MNIKNEELTAFLNVYYFFTADDFKISALHKDILTEAGYTRENIIQAAQDAIKTLETRRKKGNAKTREILRQRRKTDKNFTH